MCVRRRRFVGKMNPGQWALRPVRGSRKKEKPPVPSYRRADEKRPHALPQRYEAIRFGPDPEQRRRQRERVIASLLACPGKDGRVGEQRAA